MSRERKAVFYVSLPQFSYVKILRHKCLCYAHQDICMYTGRGLDTSCSVTGATGMATPMSVMSLQFCSSGRGTKVNQKAMGLAQH